jgi:hypothetical protein
MFSFMFLFFFIFYFQKKFNPPPLPRQSRRAQRLLHGGGGIGMQQSYQPNFILFLFFA